MASNVRGQWQHFCVVLTQCNENLLLTRFFSYPNRNVRLHTGKYFSPNDSDWGHWMIYDFITQYFFSLLLQGFFQCSFSRQKCKIKFWCVRVFWQLLKIRWKVVPRLLFLVYISDSTNCTMEQHQETKTAWNRTWENLNKDRFKV